MIDPEKIGVKLRTARESKNITQEKLEEITSITQATISKYESGKVIPPLRKLNRIAKVLDIKLEDLKE